MQPRDNGPANTRAKQLKRKRKPKPPPMVPHGPGGQMLRPAPKVTQRPRSAAEKRAGARTVERAAKAPRSPAFQPGLPEPALRGQQRQARRRTEASQRKLPPRPVPHIPVLVNPTPRQTAAARHLIARSVTRQVAPGTGSQRQAQRDTIVKELKSDPRYRSTTRAAQYYATVESDQQAERLARSMGVRGGTQADRIHAGRLLAAHPRDRVSAGPKPTRAGIRPASINLTALQRGILGATSLDQGDSGPNRFLRRVGSDAVTLGELPFVGGYQLGAAAYEASPIRDVLGGRSDTSRAKKLGKGIVKGIAHEVAHPVQSFSQHPLLTALDALGATSVIGRGIGAGLRGVGSTPDAGGVRGAAARAGSTVRPSLALTADAAGGRVARTYSKDSGRKLFQVLMDSTREPLRHPNGSKVTVQDRGRTVTLLAPETELGRKHLANRRGDQLAGRANSRERLIRERTGSDRTVPTKLGAPMRNRAARLNAKRAGDAPPEAGQGITGRHARDIVALAVQGGITTAKHFAADLGGYAARLDREYKARIGEKGFRHSGEAKQNRANAQLARRVLGNPKALAQADRIVAEAERHGRALNAADTQKAAAGIDEPARLRRAALEVPALEHMGARHFTVKEHAWLERQAGRAETAHRATAEAAKTPAARKAAAADLFAAREHRIAVSGRPPDQARAHEYAKTEHRVAQEKVRNAADAESRAEARVRALTVRHRSERGREGVVAAYYVREKRFVMRKTADAYAKRVGVKPSEIRRVALSPAEAKRVGDLSQARQVAKNARVARREADKTVRKTRDAVAQNPLPDIAPGIRYGERARAAGFDKHPGEHLPTEHIEEFLRSRGRDPGTVAYLPHRGDVVGRRAYHAQLRPGTRPRDKGEVRTGEAYRKGATETTAQLIRDQGVRQQVQLNHAHEIDRVIGEHGMRHPAWLKAKRGEPLTAYERKVADAGGYLTPKEGLELQQRLAEDSGEYVVPVRAHAALSADTQHVIREDLQGPGGIDSLGQRMLNDRVVTDGDMGGRTRNVVMVSGHLVDRLNGHLRPAGPLLKAAQVLNRAFRFAVLPQPRWLTGNFLEAYVVRLTAKGSGVNVLGLGLDVTKSVQLLKRMRRSGDPAVRQAAIDLEAQGLAGLFVGQRGATNKRGLSDFPTLDQTARKAYGRIVSKLPVIESFGQNTSWLLRGGAKVALAPLKLFFLVNRAGIERGALHAGIGGFIRDELQQFTGSWLQTLRTSEDAWREAQRGMVDTATQHRLTDELHELLGKYDAWSPMMRAIVQGPAPFLPWMLNAIRFVYWTMPAHHSALNALLVKAGQVVESDWKTLHANTPPGSLRQAIPNGRGGWVDLARYSPYGATVPIAEGDLQGITQQFYPQAGGAVKALQGKDPFGRDLKVQPSPANPKGQAGGADKARIAFNQTLEALVPYLATGRRLQEGGRTALADSTVLHPRTKPGTDHGMSALRRVFDPFRPTYLGAPVTGGRSTPPRGRVAGRSRQAEQALQRLAPQRGPAMSPQAQEALRRIAALP